MRFGYYELFNVGHTRIKCPLKPNVFQKLLGTAGKLREQYEAFEARLNSMGWKTISE